LNFDTDIERTRPRRRSLLYLPILCQLAVSCRGQGTRTNVSFVDPNWRAAVEGLLAAFDVSLGSKPAAGVAKSLADNDVLAICSEMSLRTYRAGAWVSPQAAPNWNVSPPQLQRQATYTVVAIDAADPLSQHYSMRSGGILFEDPFYAILACYNAGYRGQLLTLPQVADWQEAWTRREKIVQSIAAKKYDPKKWFIECLPGSGGGDLRPEFLSLAGEVLGELRESGLGNLPTARGLAKYALYFRR